MADDPQPETPHFGDLLRVHRLAADLTQEALAERAGLSTRGISDLERGARMHPYRETLNLLVSALGLSSAERAAFVNAARRPSKPVSAAMTGRLTPLPIPLNALIGRHDELATIGGLLRQANARIVTLTGPGGVGKTRLALAVAEGFADAFPDGVAFADLATLRDPRRVAPVIVSALGLEGHKASPLEAARRFLGTKRILLVLDNFEHLLEAAPIVSELVQAGPDIVILITSREPLRLRGEREVAVSTLEVPELAVGASPEQLAASAAVRLFMERAGEAKASFDISPENVSIVAAICRQLDGLPLAIELAAARLKVLPPEALLGRLEQRLPLLTGGPRDAPGRQRTLRDAIAWSYDLLDAREQAVFRWLGVFAGGWTLEAAAAVVPEDGELDLLDTLASLIDKSLVRLSVAGVGAVPRYTMLETIREFALERLQPADGEDCAVRGAHARYFCELAEGARSGLVGPDQVDWFARLDAEDANLHAALTWVMENEDPESVLRFAGSLWRYWITRGRLGEGRDWLQRALDRPGANEAPPIVLADVHNGLGNVLGDMGEYRAARRHHEAALSLRRARDDAEGIAGTLNNLGLIAAWLGDYDEALTLHQESLELRRSLDDALGEAQSLSNLGDVLTAQGHLERARWYQEKALELRSVAHDATGIAYAHYNLGEIARLRGDIEEAEPRLIASHHRFAALGDKLGIAYAQCSLGDVASLAGESARAAAFLADALQARLELGDKRGLIECFEAVGIAALRRGADDKGLRLLAMARAQREAISCPLPPSTQTVHEREIENARRRLGDTATETVWRNADSKDVERALRLAREALIAIAD